MAATETSATAGGGEDGGPLFTRGGLNMPDTRGLSMVAKHAEKQQKEKEARALEKLKVLLPRLGPVVRAVALNECGWDEERAVLLLRRFQVGKADELAKVQKERRRHQLLLQKGKVDAGHHHHKRQESASDSGNDSSSGDDGSGSDSAGERSQKRKRSRSPSRAGSKRSKKERKEKRSGSKKGRKDKKRHKEKKEKRESKTKISKGALGQEYGKYGIIRETDMYAKRPEFQLWAMEMRSVDLEAMPRGEEKELFKDYMEEYNTATLPHRKYYDLELYEKQAAAKAAKKGAKAVSASTRERAAFDDEAELKREIQLQRARQHQERLKQAYVDLKTDADKAQDMKEQRLLRAEMELAYKTGDRVRAQRIAARLEPDDPLAPKAPRAPKR